MTSRDPDAAEPRPRPYRGATEDVPPPSREIALRDAMFWLGQVEVTMQRIDGGHGTSHDQRVIHQGPLVTQRLLDFAEWEDPQRWRQAHPAVEKVVAEALAHSLSGRPYDAELAAADAARYRPHLERALRDLEVLKLRLTLS